jgi:hypothetical protein
MKGLAAGSLKLMALWLTLMVTSSVAIAGTEVIRRSWSAAASPAKAIFTSAPLEQGGKNEVHVVLNGEPKSGTTWLEWTIKAVIKEACAHMDDCHLREEGRNIAATTASDSFEFNLSHKHEIPHVGHFNGFDFGMAPTLSDTDITEAAKSTLNEHGPEVKWVVIFRDPRDVTISTCYHLQLNCPDADGFTKEYIHNITSWIDLRYRMFTTMKELDNLSRVKILFFEEMKKDGKATVLELADHIGLHLNAEQAMRIHKQTSVEEMKDMKGIPQGGAQTGKVREGAACGFKNELSQDAMDNVTSQMRSILNGGLVDMWKC